MSAYYEVNNNLKDKAENIKLENNQKSDLDRSNKSNLLSNGAPLTDSKWS